MKSLQERATRDDSGMNVSGKCSSPISVGDTGVDIDEQGTIVGLF